MRTDRQTDRQTDTQARHSLAHPPALLCSARSPTHPYLEHLHLLRALLCHRRARLGVQQEERQEGGVVSLPPAPVLLAPLLTAAAAAADAAAGAAAGAAAPLARALLPAAAASGGGHGCGRGVDCPVLLGCCFSWNAAANRGAAGWLPLPSCLPACLPRSVVVCGWNHRWMAVSATQAPCVLCCAVLAG